MAQSGKDGVVLFSMGATFDASIAPPQLLRALLSAFSKLRQRVLMKVSGSLPQNLAIPSNVRVERWLPQQDVLGNTYFYARCVLNFNVYSLIFYLGMILILGSSCSVHQTGKSVSCYYQNI